MNQRKKRYPGSEEAERQRSLPPRNPDDEPDNFGMVPNYEKFIRQGWTVEEILVRFNMD